MKKFIVPSVLVLGLVLASVFWFPKEKPAVVSVPPAAPPIVEAPTELKPAAEVLTRKAAARQVPSSALDDIGSESLTEEEIAVIEANDKELNAVRERWAEARQKIYRRLKVTAEEERQLAEAADTFEGELQTQNESTASVEVADEINRELDDATHRFDRRTSDILGAERFEVLVKERDKFNRSLRAEGVGSSVGSFW